MKKKKLFVTTILMLSATFIFASKIDGKWKATIDTDNGPFSFTVEYKTDGEKLSGNFSSDTGDLPFTDGKIVGGEFEYTFEIQGYVVKHSGKLVGDKIEIKSISDYGDSEFTMTRAE